MQLHKNATLTVEQRRLHQGLMGQTPVELDKKDYKIHAATRMLI